MLVDAKDWVGYPPEGATWWQDGAIDEGLRQLREADKIDGTVRWEFSEEASANEVRRLFDDRDNARLGVNRIEIVVVKK